jgi:predicted permease
LQWVRNGLVALEFALALPLLAAAGLLIHSLVQLHKVDPGFEAEPLLTARARLLETSHPDAAARAVFWERALTELRGVPGVQAVSLAGTLPPECGCYNNFDIVGRPAEQGSQPASSWITVSAGYFDTLGVPLREGRGFDTRDTADSPPVVLVTESWAKRFFPGESAVGRQLYEGGNTETPVTVIGVVGDVRFDGLRNPGEAVFSPLPQAGFPNPLFLHLRAGAEPLSLVEPLRATLTRLDPTLVPAEVSTMRSRLDESLSDPRHWAIVIAGFALVAVLLSTVGAFGVLAYSVSRQHREIGIRLALGADAWRVASMVMRRGLASALAGTAVGVGLAVLLTRGLESLLFRVERLDPLNLIAASGLLLAVAVASCWFPARRAGRIDPLVALRTD